MRKADANHADQNNRSRVVTSAVCRAANRMDINQAELARILGLSEPTVSRMVKGEYMLKEGKKEYEIAVILLRVFRSLDAITGGDERVNREWTHNYNEALGDVPAQMLPELSRLMHVVNYLDSQRAPL